ncbi:MAG: hypothetical protein KKG92_09295 [Gammaproteobacteria bacterium]|nr:hypothetical protein [Gammaproteobacteria bacterium]
MPDRYDAPIRVPWALAPAYLGMNREEFDAKASPFLRETPNGRGSTYFYRKDLDAWADKHKREQGRPSKQPGAPRAKPESK